MLPSPTQPSKRFSPDRFNGRSAIVRLTARGEHRLRAGQVRVASTDIDRVVAAAGDLVSLVGPRGHTLGYGLFSDRSAVAVRVLTHGDRRPDGTWWEGKLRAALAYRDHLDIGSTAYRLVHAEGDGLPSLVVDRYGEMLVVQALSQGIDRNLDVISDMLIDLVRPVGVVARHDIQVRALEGLPRTVELLNGEVPQEVEVIEGGLRLLVDPWAGASTGLFLDHRETREAVGRYARGRGLDCFCDTGAFALRLGEHCHEVVAVDRSRRAVEATARHATLNGLSAIQPRAGDAFQFLRDIERQDERFDIIVLDPPVLERSRSAMPRALAAYKELNQRAIASLAHGGTLVTCCRSPYLNDVEFSQFVSEAAATARASVVVIETRLQSRDHPVLMGCPETVTVRCLVLRRTG